MNPHFGPRSFFKKGAARPCTESPCLYSAGSTVSFPRLQRQMSKAPGDRSPNTGSFAWQLVLSAPESRSVAWRSRHVACWRRCIARRSRPLVSQIRIGWANLRVLRAEITVHCWEIRIPCNRDPHASHGNQNGLYGRSDAIARRFMPESSPRELNGSRIAAPRIITKQHE